MAITLTPELAAEGWTQPNDTTLVSGDGETEIGDAEQVDFFPQVKLKRWRNEANFSIRIDLPNFTPDVLRCEGNEVQFRNSDIGVRMRWHEDGRFKMAIWLFTRPADNFIDFTLSNKEVNIYPQLPLTQDQIDRGAVRPTNVEYSLAVYYPKRGNEYKVGKICHLFRPELHDQNGRLAWGRWSVVDAGRLRMLLPSNALNNASYPVVIR